MPLLQNHIRPLVITAERCLFICFGWVPQCHTSKRLGLASPQDLRSQLQPNRSMEVQARQILAVFSARCVATLKEGLRTRTHTAWPVGSREDPLVLFGVPPSESMTPRPCALSCTTFMHEGEWKSNHFQKQSVKRLLLMDISRSAAVHQVFLRLPFCLLFTEGGDKATIPVSILGREAGWVCLWNVVSKNSQLLLSLPWRFSVDSCPLLPFIHSSKSFGGLKVSLFKLSRLQGFEFVFCYPAPSQL